MSGWVDLDHEVDGKFMCLVPPHDTLYLNAGAIWQCDCGQRFEYVGKPGYVNIRARVEKKTLTDIMVPSWRVVAEAEPGYISAR